MSMTKSKIGLRVRADLQSEYYFEDLRRRSRVKPVTPAAKRESVSGSGICCG